MHDINNQLRSNQRLWALTLASLSAIILVGCCAVLFYVFSYDFFVIKFREDRTQRIEVIARQIDGALYQDIFSQPVPSQHPGYKPLLNLLEAAKAGLPYGGYLFTLHRSLQTDKPLLGLELPVAKKQRITLDSEIFSLDVEYDSTGELSVILSGDQVYSGALPQAIVLERAEGKLIFEIRQTRGIPLSISLEGQTLLAIMQDKVLTARAGDGTVLDENNRTHYTAVTVRQQQSRMLLSFIDKGESTAVANSEYFNDRAYLRWGQEVIADGANTPNYIFAKTLDTTQVPLSIGVPFFTAEGAKAGVLVADFSLGVLTEYKEMLARRTLILFVPMLIIYVCFTQLLFELFMLRPMHALLQRISEVGKPQSKKEDSQAHSLLFYPTASIEKTIISYTRKWQEASFHDPLTGALNRRYYEEILLPEMTSWAESLSSNSSERSCYGLMMFDLDHFKNLNDTYGHQAGDVVLQSLAAQVGLHIRGNDVLIRMGGEEFLAVFRGINAAQLPSLAEKMRLCVRKNVMYEYRPDDLVSVTCSVGFAPFPLYPRTPLLFPIPAYLNLIDMCMYRAKHRGRDCSTGVLGVDTPRTEAEVEIALLDLNEGSKKGFYRIVDVPQGGEASTPFKGETKLPSLGV